jgi:PleD family two-component response regulator
MSHTDIPILVVDDAKFSSAIIAKTLSKGGFANVRFTNNPFQALRSLDKRPAQILIADWAMPSMDGLELARRVREQDSANNHRTYVLLLSEKDNLEAIEEALAVGADDFLNKAQLRAQLLAKVLAAHQLAQRHNDLLAENAVLQRQIADLTATDIIDPVTGLGNLKYTLDKVNDLTRQVEARGGAACLLLVGINNLDVIREQHDQLVIDELISGFGAKLRNLVRPLDVVTRPEMNILAVTMQQPSIDNCNSQSFRRIFDNLYMHSFKTSEGFIPVVVGVSICAADDSTGLPDAKTFMRAAYDALTRSFETGIITVSTYNPDQAAPHAAMWA